jgi:hypothetical protein
MLWVSKALQIFDYCNIEERTNKVRKGVEFIFSHFESRQQLFPRKMSTAFSNGRQFTVYSKYRILNECIKSNFLDCRINAFPDLPYSRIPIHAPNIVFIDLDLSKDLQYADALKQLNKAKNKSLKTIKERLRDCKPSVLWTGNGYHIYIVLNTRPLDLIRELKELSSKPSEEFLRYAEMTFSNRKKDSAHNTSFKSSLLRIPYTFNSKDIDSGNETCERSEIKIIGEFDKNNVPPIDTDLLRCFRLCLAEKDINNKRSAINRSGQCEQPNLLSNNKPSNCFWIEKLLRTPIPNFRRYCLYHIMIPYLINVKKLSNVECICVLEKWLEECNNFSKVSFNMETEIDARLKAVKGYRPMSLQKLKTENFELYHSIFN